MRRDFWKSKRVLITGHTGFKGSWLSLWLQYLGAEVYGFSLMPDKDLNLYNLAQVGKGMESAYGNILDYEVLRSYIQSVQPDIIFHLAAQPLVRESYYKPIETFSTNVMGTAHLLEAARHTDSVRVVINVTSDKCYENNNQSSGFSEEDPVGGADPYSASKGCAELVTAAYERSYFCNTNKLLSSVRAGNVIGGGDWASDRLVPDIVRAVISRDKLIIRNPNAIRPWQHVLDCLNGYLVLAQKMWDFGKEFTGPWNFGPGEDAILSVDQILDEFKKNFGDRLNVIYENDNQLYEASRLVLNTKKVQTKLSWEIQLPIFESIQWTIEWYSTYINGFADLTMQQINRFEHLYESQRVKSDE